MKRLAAQVARRLGKVSTKRLQELASRHEIRGWGFSKKARKMRSDLSAETNYMRSLYGIRGANWPIQPKTHAEAAFTETFAKVVGPKIEKLRTQVATPEARRKAAIAIHALRQRGATVPETTRQRLTSSLRSVRASIEKGQAKKRRLVGPGQKGASSKRKQGGVSPSVRLGLTKDSKINWSLFDQVMRRFYKSIPKTKKTK